MKKKFLVLLFFILIPFFSFAEDEYPNNSDFDGYVYDEVGILSQEDKDYINNVNDELKEKTNAEIAILIKEQIDEELASYKTKAFEKLKIGSEKKDNGLLLVIDYNDHEIGIETGYETEGFITDIESSNIIDNMADVINSENLKQGVISGFNEILDKYKKEYNVKINLPEKYDNYESTENEFSLSLVIFLIFIFLIFRRPLFYVLLRGFFTPQRRRKRRNIEIFDDDDDFFSGFGGFSGGSFSSGSSGSSGSSFGGGSSGGGGATGGW
ncbi:MAG: TPM domain-containing protein [Peptoniphilaceae bacterium]|nr:TPM domain-containing protein [Peptoniphilaceae bacterium]MDD7383664.1 TPM domain-containing protein [Peptoniphilaceae bacterium]MDY3737835.1 TPM domain-containing protein [Peptoniphilaceae bacterium]